MAGCYTINHTAIIAAILHCLHGKYRFTTGTFDLRGNRHGVTAESHLPQFIDNLFPIPKTSTTSVMHCFILLDGVAKMFDLLRYSYFSRP
jgi:hypothetical protein